MIGGLPGADRQEWLDRFGAVTGPLNAKGFFITVDRKPIAVEFKGFDLLIEEHPRYTFHLEGELPPSGRLEIYDTNYATSEGTSRLAIRARDGAEFTGDNSPNEVAEIPIRPVWEMTDEEELRSKRVVVTYSSSTTKRPAQVPPASPSVSNTVPLAEASSPPPAQSRAASRELSIGLRLREFLDRNRHRSMPGLLLIAAFLGAAHSLLPGHGKLLISSISLRRGARWYHPVVLGLTASLTHTGSVLLIATALWLTGTSRVEGLHQVLVRGAGLFIGLSGFWRMGRFLGGHGEHPNESISFNRESSGTFELVGLGFTGGLVPCWDAVGLIVLAAALGRLTLGVLCVLAFGMAFILLTVGLLAVRFWSTSLARTSSPRFEKWLGFATGLILAIVGLPLFFG